MCHVIFSLSSGITALEVTCKADGVRQLRIHCFRAFSCVGSHLLIHSCSSQAGKVPLVPQQNMKNIKPQLLDKP